MSKHDTEVVVSTDQHKHLSRKNKIPDFEALFGYEEAERPAKKGFLSKLLWRNWAKILFSTLILLLQIAPVYLIPLITSDVIDLVSTRPDGYVTRIIIEAGIAFVMIIQNIFSTTWRAHYVNKLIRSTTATIRSALIRKLQRLSITYHKEVEEGKIQSKLLRDIENVEVYVRTIFQVVIMGIIGVLASVGIALWRSPIVTLFFLLIIPVNLLIILPFKKVMRKSNKNYRLHSEQLSSQMTTNLQMMPIIKAHGLSDLQEKKIDYQIEDVKRQGLKLDKTNTIFGSALWVVNSLLKISCLFFSAFMCVKGYISAGEVVLFTSMFSELNGSVSTLINSYPTLVSGSESERSLSEILTAHDLEHDSNKRQITNVKGEVSFDGVFYHYPNDKKAVIHDFNLNVKAGERIAVVGGSGSGKSTIMNLLIGLLEPTYGRIYIDGVPLDEIPKSRYRQFISIVPQNSILFSGTIRENITFGLNHYSEEQLNQVINDANINEFLHLLPNGIDSQVGEHGDKLSGGQKQRISIARALIRNPKILIMDEATSALDNVAEFHVQRAVDRLVKERTTFTVAHRLSTIRNADRILVLDDGRLVEIGTYDELMAKKGKFFELEKLSRINQEVQNIDVESAS